MFLRRNINTIFLMLGNECNLNCKYCLQHPLVTHPISHEINPDIYDFMEQICKENEGHILDIRFWGGEPLVFYPTIQEVVDGVKSKKLPIRFALMTNGKLLNKEMVEYFIKNKINVSISWDGPNVLETRGYDVIKEKKELLFKLPRLFVSAVLSSKAYPKEILEAFQELDDEYREIHNGKHIGINIDDIFNTGDVPEELLDIDYDRVSREIEEMTYHWLKIASDNNGFNESDQYMKDYYINDLFQYAYTFYSDKPGCNNGKWDKYWCVCSNGYSTLNLGIDGKLYPCHNTSHSIGTIYDTYFKYLKNLIKEDLTFQIRDTCKDCEVLSYCLGGCKMVSIENREKTYCKLKKAVFSPVLKILTELGSTLNSIRGDNNGS